MTLAEFSDKLRSVHPQLKVLYFVRIVWYLLLIPSVFAIFYEIGKSPAYYVVFTITCLILPHIEFCIAATSKDPRRTETLIIHPFEYAFFAFWLPIMNFNPFMIVLALISLAVIAFTDKQSVIYVIVLRLLGLVVSVGLSTAIFGFNFQTNMGALSTIFAGGFVVLFTYIHLIATYKTTREITFTRKQVKQALLERNQAYQKLNDDLKVAESYVRNMLPLQISEGCVRTKWLFHPSTILGGDAFGYYWLDPDHFAVYLLDVSGHGVGAALLSVSVLNDLRSRTLKNVNFKHPSQVLSALNRTFPSDKHDDMFVTAWYGVFNKQNQILTYASAGHPPAMLIDETPATRSARSAWTLLKTPNCVIGSFPDKNFEENNFQIQKGNALYVFSDGVYEVAKPDGKMWRFSEFQAYLNGIIPENGSRLDKLFKHVKSICDSESFVDDFSIIEIVFI